MHSRTLLLMLVAVPACGRLSFDAATEDGALPSGDAFDLSACRTTPGLVAYWPFDEGTGTVAHDASSYAQDGDVIGPAVWTTGRIGGALEFTTDATVSLQQTSGMTFGGGMGSFTFSYWVHPASLTNVADIRPFEIAFCTGASYILAHLSSDGSALFSGYDANNIYAVADSPPGTVQIGQWTHLAYVFDRTNGTGQSFVNGGTGPVSDISAWTGAISCSDPMLAKNLGGWGMFDYQGRLDDIRVYDRALSAAEILALASKTTSGCP